MSQNCFFRRRVRINTDRTLHLVIQHHNRCYWSLRHPLLGPPRYGECRRHGQCAKALANAMYLLRTTLLWLFSIVFFPVWTGSCKESGPRRKKRFLSESCADPATDILDIGFLTARPSRRLKYPTAESPSDSSHSCLSKANGAP